MTKSPYMPASDDEKADLLEHLAATLRCLFSLFFANNGYHASLFSKMDKH